MKCTKCGVGLKGQESFCTKCGTKIPQNYILNAVNSYKSGDNTAFEIIYTESYATVKTACLSVIGTGNPGKLEDMVQESYLRIIKGIKTYNPEKSSFLTWAGKVALNTAISDLRKMNVETVPMVQDTGDEEVFLEFEDETIDYSPELQYETAEREKLINDILLELSERQRECIVLYYMNQMKIAEIADALDMQENTVKVNLHRGRKKVEDRVNAMEKQGIKLLGLAPIVFFASLLVSEKRVYAKEASVSFVENGIGMLVSWNDIPDTLEMSKNIPDSIVKNVGKTTRKTLAKKIVIGLVAISLAIGGGYAIGHQTSGTTKKEATADDKTAKKKDVRVVDKKEQKEETKAGKQTEETQPQEAEQAVEEPKDPLEIYKDVLEDYHHAWREGYAAAYTYADSALHDAYYYNKTDNLYYSIYDLCGDGTPELFIATYSTNQNGESYYTIWDIYSTDGNSVMKTIENAIDSKSIGYIVFSDGIIEIPTGEPGNAGGTTFYQLSSGQQQANWIDQIFHDGAYQVFWRLDTNGNTSEISADEYQQIQNQYTGTDITEQLTWTPISNLYN